MIYITKIKNGVMKQESTEENLQTIKDRKLNKLTKQLKTQKYNQDTCAEMIDEMIEDLICYKNYGNAGNVEYFVSMQYGLYIHKIIKDSKYESIRFCTELEGDLYLQKALSDDPLL